MKVERVKYIIWAKDMERCVDFLLFSLCADIIKNEHIAELLIENSILVFMEAVKAKEPGQV